MFVFIGGCIYLITDPEAAKQILVTNYSNYLKKGAQVKITPTPGKSLFLAHGKEFARQKKMISPVFKVSNLKLMVEVMQRKASLLVKVNIFFIDFVVSLCDVCCTAYIPCVFAACVSLISSFCSYPMKMFT